MQSKLQELTEKIYQEGVEKGNVEADQIVEKARNEAASIIENARKEAEIVVEQARKKAAETKLNTESEIKLSARQAINAMKQQIVDLVNGEITKNTVKSAFDKDFTKKIIEITLTNWIKSGQSIDLHLLLPKEDEKSLSAFFQKEAKQFIDKGVTIQFDPSLKAGFHLSPKDGSYKVSFTDDDFINFFKQYLRPRLVEILFSAE
jgi:V/A-type H+-transporting ATPase subunit E